MSTLLVASEGGHLVELHLLARSLNITDRTWVTFDSPQSRSLLANERVHFAPYVGSRDLIGTASAVRWARGLLSEYCFDAVVSTGAAIALAILPLAARRGAKCYYFESAARTIGPSLTGHLLEHFKTIDLFTQHEGWASNRWKYYVSIFDGFQFVPLSRDSEPRSVVVSLGMHKGYNFRRAVERLVRIIPSETKVLWQTGDTDTSGIAINAHATLPASDLAQAMCESDAIITHAGIGSIVSALLAGKVPVVLPRRKEFNEHVDDHQSLIALELRKRHLAEPFEANEVRWEDIVQAAASGVSQKFTFTPQNDVWSNHPVG